MSRARTIASLGLGLCVLAVWMVQHHYGDIRHDAELYSLLALARLHPELLSGDIFLRFGSQDHFTLFSPAFTFMIRHFDLAAAAAIMTFISQAALCACAWHLARRFMSAQSALLAVGLLLALPGFYGSGHIFSYTEDFLTPRLPAAALALASLTAALSGRTKTAVGCIVAALLIHPIIACAGLVMLVFTCFGASHPRTLVLLSASALLTALLTAVLMPAGPFARFDPEWLSPIYQTTGYLFVTKWRLDDWARLAIPLAVLLLGGLFSAPPVLRAVCVSAIACSLAGIALTGIWCDLLHVILPTQMQLWRWGWITSVLAVLLAPLIAADSWSSGNPLRRAALVFIASSLLLRADSGAAFTVAFAIMTTVLARYRPQFAYGRYILFGALAFLVLAVGLAVGDGVTISVPLVLGLYAAWWIGEYAETSQWKALTLAGAAAIACLVATPGAVHSWTRFFYTPARHQQYAEWRDHLPARAEVLWPEQPMAVWYLLERPSYWSIIQTAGNVFSRPAAVELDRRIGNSRSALMASSAYAKLAQDADFVKQLHLWTPGSLESLDLAGFPILCADPALGYFVTARRVGPTAFAPITPNPDKPNRHFYLYSCKDFRGS
jgi:hypothetical protein